MFRNGENATATIENIGSESREDVRVEGVGRGADMVSIRASRERAGGI